MAAQSELSESIRRSDFIRNFDRIIDGATLALDINPSASMREIAEHSGVARATLYRHFPSRDDLLRAIYRSGVESAGDAIRAAEPQRGTAIEALKREIEALISVVGRYRILVEQRLNYPDLRPEADAAFEPLTELVERGQAEGSIRSDLSGRWLSSAMIVLCVSAVAAIGRGDLKSAEAAEVVATTLIDPVGATG